MTSALYIGKISHTRHLPKHHSFSYPFFMYFLCLDTLEKHPDIGIFFSVRRWALNRFHRPDYYGDRKTPLHEAIKKRMEELTGEAVQGKVYGLMNMRTLGLYFSPVNFYYGFDAIGNFSHFLAEVSNIPWNERHQYAYSIKKDGPTPCSAKSFKVSPFNPINQQYRWQISAPAELLTVGLEVHDQRGHVFDAALELKRYPLRFSSLIGQLIHKPVMTAFIVAGIYWQAFKLFIKGIPYIPYEKET